MNSLCNNNMFSNPVDIGDKVYIGGLFGFDFTEINNKFGKVEKITFSSTPTFATYMADVLIDDEKVVTVNLAYLFKFDNIYGVNQQMHFSGSVSDPLNYYYRKFRVIGTPSLVMDELGRSFLFCQTRENSMESLTLTNLN